MRCSPLGRRKFSVVSWILCSWLLCLLDWQVPGTWSRWTAKPPWSFSRTGLLFSLIYYATFLTSGSVGHKPRPRSHVTHQNSVTDLTHDALSAAVAETMNAYRKSITHEVRLNNAVVLTDVFTETQKYRLQYNLQHRYLSTYTMSDCVRTAHIIHHSYRRHVI